MLRHLTQNDFFSIDKLVTHVRMPLYRNAYALMVSTAATSVFGMLYWILAARYYSADVVGLNAAAVSMLTFLAGVAQGPSMSAMLRYIPVAGSDTKRLVVWAYLSSTLLALLVGGAFLLSINFWSPLLSFLGQDGWLALWFLLGVVGWCIFALQDNVLTGLRETIYVPIENIPYAVVKIGLLIVFAAGFSTYGILASWTVPMILTLLPVNYLIFRTLIPRHHQAHKEERLAFGRGQISYYVAGNYLAFIFQTIVLRLLPVMVTNVAGATASAYFYLPFTLAISLRLIIANMSTSFTVEVAANSHKLRAYSYRFLLHTTALMIPAIIVIWFAGPYILRFSGRSYAEEGTQLLRLLALTALPNVIISLHLGVTRVQQRVAEVIIRQFALCVLTLGLSYIFLKMYGIVGVGVAVLVSESVVALVLLFTSLWPIIGTPLFAKYSSVATRSISVDSQQE
jgi:O-antigen/teichoic acid export membrane protein